MNWRACQDTQNEKHTPKPIWFLRRENRTVVVPSLDVSQKTNPSARGAVEVWRLRARPRRRLTGARRDGHRTPPKRLRRARGPRRYRTSPRPPPLPLCRGARTPGLGTPTQERQRRAEIIVSTRGVRVPCGKAGGRPSLPQRQRGPASAPRVGPARGASHLETLADGMA